MSDEDRSEGAEGQEPDDEVQLPEERVDDLEPSEAESEGLAGGTYNWWKK